jgi:hypothetical protein
MSEINEVQVVMLGVFKDTVEQMGNAETIKCDDEMILFGAGAVIDSLTLVSFIVGLEDRLSEYFGKVISLTDDRAMTREISPFDTFLSLKKYIHELVNE